MKDLTGQKFGYLTVLEQCEKIPYRHRYWKCQCKCGKIKSIDEYNLIKGKSISCGCYRNKLVSERRSKHNMTDTRLYTIWVSMRDRCNNPNKKAYKDYGGRGIKVCNEWQNDFISFYTWAINNGYNENAKSRECTIERINVDGNYEPQNCTFKNSKEQANNRRNNIIIEYNNETHTLMEWCEILGLNYKRTLRRYHIMINGSKNIKNIDDLFNKTSLKRNNVKLTYNNKTLTVSEWSKLLSIPRNTIWDRYDKGFCVEDILYKGNFSKKLSQERR